MPTPPPRRPPQSRAEKARERAARRTRKRPMSLDSIVDVALRIVDAEGTAAVSMRRVAAEFDTGPASLYAYVADKDELLRHVLDRIIDEVEVPDAHDWRAVVRGWALGCHEVFVRHQDAARLSFAHVPQGDKVIEVTEAVLGAMVDAGVPPVVASWALDTISLYVGADAFEGWLFAQRFGPADPGSDPSADGPGLNAEATDFFEDLHDTLAGLPADRFPHIAAHVDALTTGSGEERFAFGLDLMLDGIAARITP